jgi:hypothetical protein
VGAEVKHAVIGTKAVTAFWHAPGLSAQIRVRWFPDSSRPKNTPTYLLIDFGRYLPLTDADLRLLEAGVPALVEPPSEAFANWVAWETAMCASEETWQASYGEQAQAQEGLRKRLYTPQKTMTVRVWLDHAHNPYKAIRWVPRELKDKGWTLEKWQAHLLDEERQARTRRLARGEAPSAWNWLCLSPQLPGRHRILAITIPMPNADDRGDGRYSRVCDALSSSLL